MEKIVSTHQLGKISPDFEPKSLAVTINSMDESIILNSKENSNQAASIFNATSNLEQVYCWMKEN